MGVELGMHCGGLVNVSLDTRDLWDPHVVITYYATGRRAGCDVLPGWTTHEAASQSWSESERAWVDRWRAAHGQK